MNCEVVSPQLSKSQTFIKDAMLTLLGTGLITLSGKISIPLGFTPVPLVLQAQVVLLVSHMLGARRGAIATLLFLAQGAMGLPVFSVGATQGLARLLSPTGGYLTGYLMASFVTPIIYGLGKRRGSLKAFISIMAGTLLIYALGATHLATFIGWSKALLLGVCPFIIPGLLKAVAATAAFTGLKQRGSASS